MQTRDAQSLWTAEPSSLQVCTPTRSSPRHPPRKTVTTRREFWEDLPVIAISICGIGAIIAVAGLRYHPVILAIGAVIIVIGGLDIGGIISLF